MIVAEHVVEIWMKEWVSQQILVSSPFLHLPSLHSNPTSPENIFVDYHFTLMINCTFKKWICFEQEWIWLRVVSPTSRWGEKTPPNNFDLISCDLDTNVSLTLTSATSISDLDLSPWWPWPLQGFQPNSGIEFHDFSRNISVFPGYKYRIKMSKKRLVKHNINPCTD